MAKRGHDQYQYITAVRGRWRTQVAQEHVGMYDTPYEAAMMADAFILGQLEQGSLEDIGRWELNFPDKIPTRLERTLLYLHFHDHLMPWIGNEGNGPQINDFIKRPEIETDDNLASYFERLYFGQQIMLGYRIVDLQFPGGAKEFVTLARDFDWDESFLWEYAERKYRNREDWSAYS